MKKAIFSLAVIISLASCKKDKSGPANTCTANATTIAGTYKITAVTYKQNASAAATDAFTSLPDCQKDDTYVLNTDGSVTISDAGVSCGLPPAPGGLSGWWLENNNTLLKMTDLDLQIVSFDCKTLVVKQTGVFSTDDVRTTTYVKQ